MGKVSQRGGEYRTGSRGLGRLGKFGKGLGWQLRKVGEGLVVGCNGSVGKAARAWTGLVRVVVLRKGSDGKAGQVVGGVSLVGVRVDRYGEEARYPSLFFTYRILYAPRVMAFLDFVHEHFIGVCILLLALCWVLTTPFDRRK